MVSPFFRGVLVIGAESQAMNPERHLAAKLYLDSLERARGAEPTDSYRQKVEKYYDSLSEVVLPTFGHTYQVALATEDPVESNLFFAQRAGIKEGERVLDAGCGWGGPALHIAEHFPEVRLAALSLSAKQCGVLESEVQKKGLAERISVHHADYHHLPFPDQDFDLVYFLESSGHSEQPCDLFSEVLRVLKPQGRLYLKEPFLKVVQDEERIKAVETIFTHKLSTMQEAVEWVKAAGFIQVKNADISEMVDTGPFFRAMRYDSGQLTEFGKSHAFPYPALDLIIGEITALRPA